jgi:hypothetical protein
MHKLLQNLLDKRKLAVNDLTKDELSEFRRWESILHEEVTVEKIDEFCRIQMDQIEQQWHNLDNKKLKNERLLMMHTVYSKIRRMITSAKTERKSVEEELNRLLDADE